MDQENLLARVPFLAISLCEMDLCIRKERQIQDIEPHDWLLALVAVVVPMPIRCDDHIAAREGQLLALNGGESLAIDDEAKRRRDMSMGRRRLSGVDELQAGVDGVCSEGSICIQT